MLVVDASAAVHLALRGALDRLADHDARAPDLLWSETTSAIRHLAWREDVEDAVAEEAVRALTRAPIRSESGSRLAQDAYRIARNLGWAKTYDAEYLALARRLDAPLLTLDPKLARTAQDLVRLAPPESI